MLLLAIVVRAALGVMRSDLAPCPPVGATLILTSPNLIVKLVIEFELSMLLDTLKFHAFELNLILICRELGFKKLSDQLKSLSIEFPARCGKLVAVVLVE